MPDINDICYVIAVTTLLGILLLVILGDINYFSGDTPQWKLQLVGSAGGAMITAIATLGAIFIKDWWDNRINVRVKIIEYAEEDRYGGIDPHILISARNHSKIDVVLDSFWLTLHYDGKSHHTYLRYTEDNRKLTDDKGSVINFPYTLEPGKKLDITMEGSDKFRDSVSQDYETGEYNIPESGCSLIAHFEDQLENSFTSPPFEIC
jgi:hypothetical protein